MEESRLEKDGFLLDFRLPPMKWPGAHTSSTLTGSQSQTMSTAPGGEAPRNECSLPPPLGAASRPLGTEGMETNVCLVLQT